MTVETQVSDMQNQNTGTEVEESPYNLKDPLDMNLPTEGEPDGGDDKQNADESKENNIVPTDKKEENSSGENNKKFDESLKEYAYSLGLDDEDLQNFESDAELNKALTLFQNKIIAAVSENNSGQQLPANPPNADVDKLVESQKQAMGFKKFEIPLKKEDFDLAPELVDTLNGMNDHYSKLVEDHMAKLNALSSNVSQLLTVQQERQRVEFQDRVDKGFNSLGETYKDVFGTDTVDKINSKSTQFKNRMDVLQMVDAMELGFSKMGKPIPSFDVLFKRAVSSLFAGKEKEVAKKEITDKLQKRSSMAMNRPTNTQKSPANGRESAIARVKDFYRKKGLE
jgi:hypothetical protein